MNQEQRDKIAKIIEQLEELESEERDKRENAPENLYYSERYEQMEETADEINDTIEQLREIAEKN